MKLTLFEKKSKLKKECRVCHRKEFVSFLNLGSQPLANNLLKRENQKELMFPLHVVRCQSCGFLQLDTVVNPKLLFGDYLYYSSTSAVFRKHFEDFSKVMKKNGIVKRGSLVVDIGSNDGVLLKPFKERGCNVVGVEPCKEIARKAQVSGIPTVPAFFTEEVADYILATDGPADLITATNVFAHVDDVDEILRGVKKLLSTEGLFVIEFPDTEQMIKQGTFDLIYHEHLSYFTKYSIARLLKSRGFDVVSFEKVPVHGGSLRVYCTPHLGIYKAFKMNWLDERWPDADMFNLKVKMNKEKTIKVLHELRIKGAEILGFGAPAKMTVLTNYYDINTMLIAVVLEDAKEKQYHYSPGSHLYIVSQDFIDDINDFDYMFIFAWNFAEPIIKRFKKEGYKGKFIIPFPKVHIV